MKAVTVDQMLRAQIHELESALRAARERIAELERQNRELPGPPWSDLGQFFQAAFIRPSFGSQSTLQDRDGPPAWCADRDSGSFSHASAGG